MKGSLWNLQFFYRNQSLTNFSGWQELTYKIREHSRQYDTKAYHGNSEAFPRAAVLTALVYVESGGRVDWHGAGLAGTEGEHWHD